MTARHRLGRQPLQRVEQRLSPARQLRVDQDDAGGGDEGGGVAAEAAAQDVEVVPHLLDHHVVRGRRRLLLRGNSHREHARGEQRAEYEYSFHRAFFVVSGFSRIVTPGDLAGRQLQRAEAAGDLLLNVGDANVGVLLVDGTCERIVTGIGSL
jgi:hypothetical protein